MLETLLYSPRNTRVKNVPNRKQWTKASKTKKLISVKWRTCYWWEGSLEATLYKPQRMTSFDGMPTARHNSQLVTLTLHRAAWFIHSGTDNNYWLNTVSVVNSFGAQCSKIRSTVSHWAQNLRFQQNLILHPSPFLSVGLISWLLTVYCISLLISFYVLVLFLYSLVLFLSVLIIPTRAAD